MCTCTKVYLILFSSDTFSEFCRETYFTYDVMAAICRRRPIVNWRHTPSFTCLQGKLKPIVENPMSLYLLFPEVQCGSAFVETSKWLPSWMSNRNNEE